MNVSAGWRLAPRGSLARAPLLPDVSFGKLPEIVTTLVSPSCVSSSSAVPRAVAPAFPALSSVGCAVARMAGMGADLVSERTNDFVLPETVRQLYHIERRVVHLSANEEVSVSGHLVVRKDGMIDVSVALLDGPYSVVETD